jgi:hypothetical protein
MPVNIRWIMDTTIIGQNNLGIETRTLLTSSTGVDQPDKARFHYVPVRTSRGFFRGYPRYFWRLFCFMGVYLRDLLWADVVHWQYSSRFFEPESRLHRFDLLLIKVLKKPAIVQFHGADFRDNELWETFNPRWSEAFDSDRMTNLTRGAHRAQRDFLWAGFLLAMGYGMLPSVKPDNRQYAWLLERTVDVKTLRVKKRDGHISKKVRIVHSPSNPQPKGSKYILPVLDEISRIRDVDVVFLNDKEHDEVLQELAYSDILVDQILGGDYGLVSVEAMINEVAVVSSVFDVYNPTYPAELPVVRATVETLKEVLLDLIDNSERRIAHASQGPDYAGRMHAVEELMPAILGAYRQAALMRKSTRVTKRIEGALMTCRERGWGASAYCKGGLLSELMGRDTGN